MKENSLVSIMTEHHLNLMMRQVLEHLATHKVLTVEHIYADPPRSGMERSVKAELRLHVGVCAGQSF